jgi:hypothetical protein
MVRVVTRPHLLVDAFAASTDGEDVRDWTVDLASFEKKLASLERAEEVD